MSAVRSRRPAPMTRSRPTGRPAPVESSARRSSRSPTMPTVRSSCSPRVTRRARRRRAPHRRVTRLSRHRRRGGQHRRRARAGAFRLRPEHRLRREYGRPIAPAVVGREHTVRRAVHRATGRNDHPLPGRRTDRFRDCRRSGSDAADGRRRAAAGRVDCLGNGKGQERRGFGTARLPGQQWPRPATEPSACPSVSGSSSATDITGIGLPSPSSSGSARFQLGAGGEGTVHVQLNGRARNLLASAPGRRLGVRATITLNGSTPASTGLELVQTRQRHQHA